MANVLVVYGSTTGNTENAANKIAAVLKGAGNDVTLLDVGKAQAAGLCAGRDCVLFGCSTWGDETIELQDDFVPLFDDFGNIGISGVKAAAFGCGDTSYTYYCGAVDAINEKLEQLDATVIAQGLKIDSDPDDAKDEIEAWASEIAEAV